MLRMRDEITDVYRKAWNDLAEKPNSEFDKFDPVMQSEEIAAVEDWIMANMKAVFRERSDVSVLVRSMTAPFGCPMTLLTHGERKAVYRAIYKTKTDDADDAEMERRFARAQAICSEALHRGSIQEFYQDAFGGTVYTDAKVTTRHARRSILKGGS